MIKHYQTKLAEIPITNKAQSFSFRRLHDVNNPSSVHGIFPYRGKISAIDAQQVIHQLPQKGILLDPFCGSGTIVYEAQRWGLTAIGVDSNPMAYALSRAKTQPINAAKIMVHSQELVRKAKNLAVGEVMNDWPRKFFHLATAEEIMRLHSFKNEMSDYELAAFYGAIALTARACNHYKWSSNSVGKIILPLLYVDFYKKFLGKVKKHIKYVDGNLTAKIFQHDSRRLTEVIEKNSVDYVYTSPPYFNALDYTSYYTRIVYEISREFDRKEIKKSLIQNFASYAEDMRKALMEIKEVMKENALVFFVVGDKKTENGIINGGEFFSNLTSWKPAHIIEREYSGSSSQIWDAINKTKRKEQIVIWSNG
jgi:DNA modification methylase